MKCPICSNEMPDENQKKFNKFVEHVERLLELIEKKYSEDYWERQYHKQDHSGNVGTMRISFCSCECHNNITGATPVNGYCSSCAFNHGGWFRTW